MISLTNCYKWYLGAANGRNFRWREYIDGRMNLISLHTFLAFFVRKKPLSHFSLFMTTINFQYLFLLPYFSLQV